MQRAWIPDSNIACVPMLVPTDVKNCGFAGMLCLTFRVMMSEDASSPSASDA